MALFQKSVLNKYLKTLDDIKVNAAYQKFTDFFHNPEIIDNIREDKEEQFQYGFLQKLFDEVLDYTINPNPNYNLTTEFKNLKGAKKADGAILKDGKAAGVIELKSTKTKELVKITDQAFGYKNNHTSCNYVITSNFEKLRFYINDAVEYIDFDLFTLSEEQFKLLYLCLQKDHILSDLALKIKQESSLQEENITKQLYKDYSAFKKTLYNDMVLNNPEVDKLLLFEKSQKLLDRFLFIFFAEDKGLLPPNSISEIIKRYNVLKAEDFQKPLYDIFKQYFEYINSGRPQNGKKAEIHAYNGGLFKADDILDSLIISDSALIDHTMILTAYDFESEVDVNILGHIFEHSLTEIEMMAAEIEGKTLDKSKTKRKKDGVFYTPKYITKYIVDNTLGKLADAKKIEIGIVEAEYRPKRNKATKERLNNALLAYREYLLSLTICDPACGSGAFLNQALDYLIKEHRYIDELQTKLLGGSIILSDITNDILEKNIYGVDINAESVDIARLSLWLRTAKKGRTLSSLNNNIKCGNSIIDSKELIGEKAFNWVLQFPQVFEKGGFDVVIGNPPYVRAEMLGQYQHYFKQNYSVHHPAGDLFSYFYEKAFNLLKKEVGLFGFISNTFDKTTAGISLREYLQKEVSILKYIDFTEVQIFEGATTYPVIITAENIKRIKQSFQFVKIPKSSQAPVIDIDQKRSVIVEQITLDKSNWSFKSKSAVDFISKLREHNTIREVYGKCYYGIKTGLNEAFIIPKTYKNDKHIKAIHEGKELSKWLSPKSIQQLILFESKWTKTKYGNTITEEVGIQKINKEYPMFLSHILLLEERAKKRYDQGDFFWELRNCAYYDLFEKPKIVFPNLQNSNKFSFDETGTYVIAPAVILPTKDKFLTAILNSKLIWYFLTNICVVRSGGYIEVKPQYFEQIPIPKINNKEILNEKTISIMGLTNQIQEIVSSLTNYIQSKHSIEKLTKKLQNWNELEFVDFNKELNKAIKKSGSQKLSKMDEMEWMEVFESKKSEAQKVKAEIEKTDNEIDRMVYELYRLTNEEIAIVEGV